MFASPRALAAGVLLLGAACSRTDLEPAALGAHTGSGASDPGQGGSIPGEGGSAGGAGGAGTTTTSSSSTGGAGGGATCLPVLACEASFQAIGVAKKAGLYGAEVLDLAGNGCGTAAVGYTWSSFEVGGTTVEGGSHYALTLDPAGNPRWAKPLPATTIHAIGVDASGGVLLAGTFAETLELDGKVIAAGLGTAFFVLSLGYEGNLRWVRSFDAAGGDDVADLAVDASGRVTLVGTYSTPVDFGGGALSADLHTFAATFSPGGEYLHSEAFGTGLTAAHAVVATADEHTVIAGSFTGTISAPGVADLVAMDGAGVHDIFVLDRDAAGQASWSKRFGAAANDAITTLSDGVDGTLWLAGIFGATLDFGGPPLTAPKALVPSPFFAHLTASGDHLGSGALPTVGVLSKDVDFPISIAADAEGGAIVSQAVGVTFFGDEPPEPVQIAVHRIDSAGLVASTETYAAQGYIRVASVPGGVALAGATVAAFELDGNAIEAPAQFVATRCPP